AQGDGREFLWITRIPRTASLVLAGAIMAMAGLVMQLMTQNRFVEPTTVGTTEWAGLGLLVTYIVGPASGVFTKMVIAIVFAFAGTL
ncbi:iron chelate uptake ABC transporter family permease subunit, partial [Klebsiella pneumoniae]|uniref:iron chelate uptake ABC transporter family permease subunit n=1 Tax=Klebsiella pneumoniae TaxID=573 RepID=UPI003013C11C